MRKYTLLLSVTVHVAVAFVLVIAPLFAAATLPEIRDVVTFVPVRVVTPPPPLGSRRSVKPPSTTTPSQDAAPEVTPTEAPDTIAPETSIATGPPGPDPGASDSGAGVPWGSIGGVITDDMSAPPPVAKAAPPPPPEPVRRVGGDIVAPRKVKHVAPIYPPIAVAAKKAGIVILEAVIAEDGSVRDVRVMRSVPLLDEAAMNAVRQWRFTPTLLGGRPVPIAMTVTVNFELN
jgi:protein TonB